MNEKWLTALVAWFDEQTVLSDEEVRRKLAKWVPEYSEMKEDDKEKL